MTTFSPLVHTHVFMRLSYAVTCAVMIAVLLTPCLVFCTVALIAAGLDPSSPLGLFIRKQRVSFMCMSFEAVAQLFTAIAEDIAVEMGPSGCFAQSQEQSQRQQQAASGGVAAPLSGVARRGSAGGSGALRERAALETYVSRLMQRIEQQVWVPASVDEDFNSNNVGGRLLFSIV